MFRKILKLVVVGLTMVVPFILGSDVVTPKEMIDEINTKALWTAGESDFTRMNVNDARQMMGTVLVKNHQRRVNTMEYRIRPLKLGLPYIKHLEGSSDCCLDGNCCHGLEYCCDECDGTCRCSVRGKCNGLENINDVKCDVCEFALGWVESKLPINATATEVELLLSEVCNIVPKDLQPGCKDLVANVADNVINALISKISPSSICSMIGLCSSRVTPRDPSIPDNFDGRQAFGKCVHPVRDQMRCGSCWAFSASEVLSDRFCISSKGAVDVVLSPQTLVSCDSTNMGCNGGMLDAAWRFMVNNGISSETCEPYTSGSGVSGTCPLKCADGSTVKYYKAANFKHLTGSIFGKNIVEVIQQDLMTNGPVQVAFEVYQDFMSYMSGVYHHVSGSLLGGHAVELVGWGVDSASNTPYWLVKNSWGVTWGDMGYFKILRGKNECGIESNAYSGTPLIEEKEELEGGAIKCELCMYVTKFVEHELTTEKVEDEIEAIIEKACAILPNHAKPVCVQFIQAELPKLIELIVAKVEPEKICDLIKAC